MMASVLLIFACTDILVKGHSGRVPSWIQDLKGVRHILTI
jgi:hypothetical protein